jgi:multisubunit Na+/H+ antiporter MnhB subunit
MTVQPRPMRRRRRRRLLRPWMVAMVALAVAFAVGLALGDALDDNHSPGKTQTSVRTLKPLAVPPAAATVTVTVER